MHISDNFDDEKYTKYTDLQTGDAKREVSGNSAGLQMHKTKKASKYIAFGGISWLLRL